MTKLNDRIIAARKNKRLSQKELASKLGIVYQTLNKYENNHREPGANILLQMAKHLEVDPGWLLTGEGSMYRKSESETKEYIMVPRYNIQTSTGNGTLIESKQIVDCLAFKTQWVKQEGLNPKSLALISAIGDSMEQTIRAGDLLLIDTIQNNIIDDAIYVIHSNDYLFAKRLQRTLKDIIYVRSDNTAYREQTITTEEAKNLLRIVGRVVWIGRRV